MRGRYKLQCQLDCFPFVSPLSLGGTFPWLRGNADFGPWLLSRMSVRSSFHRELEAQVVLGRRRTKGGRGREAGQGFHGIM